MSNTTRPGRVRKPGVRQTAKHLTNLEHALIRADQVLTELRSQMEALADEPAVTYTGSDGDNDSDSDVIAVERDRLRQLINLEEEVRQQLLDAKARAETGTWWVCVTCQGPIGLERLEAIPQAQQCVTCRARSH